MISGKVVNGMHQVYWKHFLTFISWVMWCIRFYLDWNI